MKRALLLTLLLSSTAALAAPGRGLFTGDEWRYRKAQLFPGLVARIGLDLVAMPAGVVTWEAADWALFAGVVGSTAALSLGQRSLDVQFQGFLQERVLGVGHPTVWNLTGDLAIWSTTAVLTVGLLLYGLLGHDDLAAEVATLMFEAFVVAQVYHQVIKLLTGRAGPSRPELEGQYFGPARALELWPAGTPSGHMASMYAMLAVVMYAIDSPLLWVGLNVFAMAFGAALVGDGYHWISDVILGAGLGFSVGRWVAMHRSTRFANDARGVPVRVNVVPVLLPGTGGGLALAVAF